MTMDTVTDIGKWRLHTDPHNPWFQIVEGDSEEDYREVGNFDREEDAEIIMGSLLNLRIQTRRAEQAEAALRDMTAQRNEYAQSWRIACQINDDLTAELEDQTRRAEVAEQQRDIIWGYASRDIKPMADDALRDAGLPSVEGGWR